MTKLPLQREPFTVEEHARRLKAVIAQLTDPFWNRQGAVSLVQLRFFWILSLGSPGFTGAKNRLFQQSFDARLSATCWRHQAGVLSLVT